VRGAIRAQDALLAAGGELEALGDQYSSALERVITRLER
jgi:hypothetical protein